MVDSKAAAFGLHLYLLLLPSWHTLARDTTVQPKAGRRIRSRPAMFLKVDTPFSPGRKSVRTPVRRPFQPVLGYELGQEGAIHAPRHVVPRGNGKKGARVVVEADRVIEARRLGCLLAKAQHSLWTVMKPPGRPEAAGRDSGRPGALTHGCKSTPSKSKKNDSKIALIAEAIEQGAQRVHIVGRRGISAPMSRP